ncbi:hypothetical protein VNO77_22716 [Canavalia gladiata]|uniref:Uncharacterized protein n=1 Tax=Canavalia gladiata TaxID=3824 RepID=A0AAN9L6D2_CANGL
MSDAWWRILGKRKDAIAVTVEGRGEGKRVGEAKATAAVGDWLLGFGDRGPWLLVMVIRQFSAVRSFALAMDKGTSMDEGGDKMRGEARNLW